MVGTHSHTVVVSAEERAEVLGRLRAFLDAQPETRDGEFDYPLADPGGEGRRVTIAPCVTPLPWPPPPS